MKVFKLITIILMAYFYINVGIKHFIDPDWFLQIYPPFLPFGLAAVYISGFFEVLFGVMLLIPKTRYYAGWGLIALLIAVFPANIYLAYTNGAAMDISAAVAWGRLPFQALFIGLAYWHSRDV
ncbi:MAG: DoxX family protein [Candidatus Neomarinimicrobiota bacterium]|nr:DoxX family protein [Candidatus Neomarinimicrobiota bacterium]